MRNAKTGKAHKIGESAQGVRKLDGASIRAEAQARRSHRETGQKHETKILRIFGSKKEANDISETAEEIQLLPNHRLLKEEYLS